MKVIAFGEILYDTDAVTKEKKLGGAPMNFCAHLSKMGEESFLLSSVGKDESGSEALETVRNLNVSDKYVVLNKEFNTGQCLITYNNGEPSYDLSMISAYDNIKFENNEIDEIKKENFDVFYFGTLAQREDVSQKTLFNILDNVKFNTVFYDMNLRQNYYTEEVIKESLKRSDIVKINRDEFEFLKSVEKTEMEEDFCKAVCDKYGIRCLLITLDEDGALAFESETGTIYKSKAEKCEMVSAVGAGDSFSACFMHNYMKGCPIDICLERANALGAYVVGFTEAIPDYTEDILNKIM